MSQLAIVRNLVRIIPTTTKRRIALREHARKDKTVKINITDHYLAGFQMANCKGCRYSEEGMVGTGKPCCRKLTLPIHKEGRCLSSGKYGDGEGIETVLR